MKVLIGIAALDRLMPGNATHKTNEGEEEAEVGDGSDEESETSQGILSLLPR